MMHRNTCCMPVRFPRRASFYMYFLLFFLWAFCLKCLSFRVNSLKCSAVRNRFLPLKCFLQMPASLRIGNTVDGQRRSAKSRGHPIQLAQSPLYTPWSFSFVPQTFHTLNQVLVDGKACSLSQTVTQVWNYSWSWSGHSLYIFWQRFTGLQKS